MTFLKDTSLAGNRINTGMRGGQVRLVRFFAKKVLFGTPSNSPQGGELKISSFLRKQWFYMFQQVLWLQNHWFYMQRQPFYMQKQCFYV